MTEPSLSWRNSESEEAERSDIALHRVAAAVSPSMAAGTASTAHSRTSSA